MWIKITGSTNTIWVASPAVFDETADFFSLLSLIPLEIKLGTHQVPGWVPQVSSYNKTLGIPLPDATRELPSVSLSNTQLWTIDLTLYGVAPSDPSMALPQPPFGLCLPFL